MGVSEDVRRETLEVFERGERSAPLTATEVADAVGVSRRTAYERLQRLVDAGDLRTKKVSSSGRIWWRSSPAATADRGHEHEEALDRLDSVFVALDTAFRYVYVTDTFEQFSGVPADQLVGETVTDVFPEAAETAFYEASKEAMETGDSRTFSEYYPPLKRWVDGHIYPSETGLSVYFHETTDGNTRERAVTEQREELAALTRLNDAIREISLAAITATSRTEIERQICEQLIEREPYLFAWVGRVESGKSTVTPRTAAGLEEQYLAEIEITIDDSERGRGPTGKAVRTDEPQFARDILNDPAYEPWREAALERGYRSSAAIPISHEEAFYGVLNVYADGANAFSGTERKILSQFGKLIAHAIRAVEQRKALLCDTATVVEFEIGDLDHPLLEVAPDDGLDVRFDRQVPVGDDRYAQFVTVEGISREQFEAAMTQRPVVTSVECITESEDRSFFRVTTDSLPVAEALAARGGQLLTVTTAGRTFRVIAEVPAEADVREILEQFRETYPETELRSRRPTVRGGSSYQELYGVITDRLTEKQRAALEAAYFAGYFERPRTNTGEEVAELLEISLPTFTQHIRIAQRKLFEAIFDEQPHPPERSRRNSSRLTN
jgi:HTH-type transcriptional regulator, bacterioopsin transcriptional activator and related proteins